MSVNAENRSKTTIENQQNVITVRIKKKKGNANKEFNFYTPDLFHSVFGFSIFATEDSEWKHVLDQKKGVLHFNENCMREIRPPEVKIKPKVIRSSKSNQRRKSESSQWKPQKKRIRIPVESTCSQCKKVFSTRSGLRTHCRRIHLNEKNHECKICKKKCFSFHSLKIHMVTHEERGRFECPECGKFIKHKNTFEDHLVMHTGVKSYKCHVCGTSFAYKKSWKLHLSRHSTDFKYKCNICFKLFTNKSTCRKHENNHTKRDFCGICKKSFLKIKEHMISMHNAENMPRVTCNICNQSFARQKLLNTHIKNQHTLILTCNRCRETFSNKVTIANHIFNVHEPNNKPFVCTLCRKTFATKPSLFKHTKKVHIKKNKGNCSICKKFYRESYYHKHLRLHFDLTKNIKKCK